MNHDDIAGRLQAWLATEIDHATDVEVSGVRSLDVGHSNEMLRLSVGWRTGPDHHTHDVVVRMQPPSPGLLEPYDLERQFRILRGLASTPVRAPRALFLEASGDVLGRPFMVMEEAPGTVFDERSMPAELRDDPVRVRGLTESLADQIAAIHDVDLDATGLADLGDGATHLDRELDHWYGEVRRVARGPLPAIERLHDELRRQQPEPTPRVTLVHGDAKPGNFAFVGAEVSAVFDWEMTDVGDPMTDIGYAEVLWLSPTFTSHEAALTSDEFVARWEERTGLRAHDRSWYRAMQGFKLTAIMLIGGWLVDQGHSDDLRLAQMAMAVPLLGSMALAELGVTEPLDFGDHQVRPERLATIEGGTGLAAPPPDALG